MPLFWLCLAFIAGIALSALISVPGHIWLGMAVFGLLAAWPEVRLCGRSKHPLLTQPLFRIPFNLLAAALALGGWRLQIALPEVTPQDLAWYAAGDSVKVEGQIVSYPEASASSTVAILQARTVTVGGGTRPVTGKLELRLPGGFHLSYGDVLSLEGRLDSVLDADEPAYRTRLARRGVYARMYYPELETLARDAGNPIMTAIYRLRERAQEIIYDQIPFPESALLSGILLGIDWNIPDYLMDAYRACGVLHIIAISGFNIAIITGLITRLTRRIFSPLKAGAAAIICVALYTLMVGAEPAVVRAAIMGSLAIPAYCIGRKVLALHSLVVVAGIMLAGNPFLLWDTSFQLSFLACLGLIGMVDPIQAWIGEWIEYRHSEAARQWWSPITAMVVSTLAAQFAVSPVLIQMYPRVSCLTLLANLTILPVQPIVMELGGLAVIFGFLAPPVGQLFAYAAWPFLVYSNWLAVHFGLQPNAEIDVPPGLFWVCLAAVAAALTYFTIRQVRALDTPDFEIDPPEKL